MAKKKVGKFEKAVAALVNEFDTVKLERDVARAEASALHDALRVAVLRVEDMTSVAPTESTETHQKWARFAREQFSLE